MAYSVFRVPNSIQVLPTTGNQIVSTIIGASGQSVDMEQWQNYTGTVLARIDNAGNFSGVAVSGTNATFSNNLIVLGNTTLGDNSADTITVSGTPTFIQNSTFQNALTVSGALNAYGNITLGDAAGDTITVSGTPTFAQNTTFTGDIFVNGGDIFTTAATFTIASANATAINIGSTSSTTNVNILSASGTINANGGTIASTASTMNLFNSTTTSNILNISTGSNTSGVVNISTNSTSGTITLGTSTTSTVIQGNLIVNGTTTTVNSNTVSTQDLNINVASNQASLTGINNAGLIAGSGLNVTWYYDSTNASWTSSENINAASTKTYKIAGTDVLSATTLGANVILSSLQKVGTIATGVWQGTSISTTYTDAKVASVAVAGTGLSINASTGAVTITSNATSANTANAIVTRDSGGNFSAGTITATLTGTATQVSNNLSIGSGLATTSATYNGSSAVSVGLAPITQGTNGATFAKITLDAYGRVTATGVVASGDIPSLSASQITAGTLAVAQGGTNLASYAVGDLLYASAATTIAKLAAVASGQFLVSNGVTTAPSYRNLSTPDITGALGYTPANSGSVLSGTGSSGKVALWNGAASLTNDTELAYDSTNNILSIAHGNITASNSVLTIGTTGTDVIDSFGTGVYRTAKYLLQARNSGSTEFQVSEALVVHDGTTAYLTEYGKIYTGANPLLTSLAVSIAAPNVSFTATAATAGTVVRFSKITMNN